MTALRSHRQSSDQDDSKTIEINAEMQGTLTFNDPVNLKINGQFSGKLSVQGTLTIGEKAKVQANIHGDNVVIAGKVHGDVVANKMLVLLPTSVLEGNIMTPKLNIVEGALFQGSCQMKEGEWSIEEVARYLEIDIREIENLANSGKIPGHKSGNNWSFDRDKIDDWAASARLNQ